MISVIVPIYNTENYLDRCIQSIIGQTYRQLEIILVDDGSTDNSGKICDSYAKADMRVKVVHKKNGGLQSAWLCGLRESTCEYVAFVDSDDYIKPQTYMEMYNKAQEFTCDVVMCDTADTFDDDEEVYNKNFSTIKEGFYSGDGMNIVRNNMFVRTDDKAFSFSRCDKLIKREILNKSLEYCDENCSLMEDHLVTIPLILNCNTLYYINQPFYNYYCNIQSMSKSKYPKGILEKYELAIKRIEQIISDCDDSLLPKCKEYCAFTVYTRIAMLLFSKNRLGFKCKQLKMIMKNVLLKDLILIKTNLSFEKKILRTLLLLKCYWLIVLLKGRTSQKE